MQEQYCTQWGLSEARLLPIEKNNLKNEKNKNYPSKKAKNKRKHKMVWAVLFYQEETKNYPNVQL